MKCYQQFIDLTPKLQSNSNISFSTATNHITTLSRLLCHFVFNCSRIVSIFFFCSCFSLIYLLLFIFHFLYLAVLSVFCCCNNQIFPLGSIKAYIILSTYTVYQLFLCTKHAAIISLTAISLKFCFSMFNFQA